MKNKYLDFILSGKGKNISLYQLQEEQNLLNSVIVQHFNSSIENKKFAEAFMAKFGIEEYPEGYNRGEWIVFDFGDVVIHSFVQDKREKYNLDKMWQNKKVNLPIKNSKK